MGGNLVQHALQRLAPRFYEVDIETIQGLLLGRRRHDDARVIVVQLIVEPQEVSVPARDLEFGDSIGFRSRLSPC